MIMSAFYTFLSSLYSCLLKFIILLGDVRKFLGEVPALSWNTCLGSISLLITNVSSLETCIHHNVWTGHRSFVKVAFVKRH